MNDLSFKIRPSLTKLVLRVIVLVVLGCILLSFFAEILALFICVLVLVTSYLLRVRNSPQSFAHFDDQLWLIKYTNQQHIFAELVKQRNYGQCIILTFNDEKDEKLINIWLFKDQFTLFVWKTLQKLSKLHV